MIGTFDRRRVLVRGGVLFAAAVLSVPAVFVLTTVPPTPDSFYPGCWFHAATGLHCPGCGTTRAAHSLLNGNVEQALAYNPLAFIVVPVVGWALIRSIWDWAWGGPPRRRPAARWVGVAGWGLTVAMIVFWVLRNIPVYPLTLLAPHELS